MSRATRMYMRDGEIKPSSGLSKNLMNYFLEMSRFHWLENSSLWQRLNFCESPSYLIFSCGWIGCYIIQKWFFKFYKSDRKVVFTFWVRINLFKMQDSGEIVIHMSLRNSYFFIIFQSSIYLLFNLLSKTYDYD